MVSEETLEKLQPWLLAHVTGTELSAEDIAAYVLSLLQVDGSRQQLIERCRGELAEFLHGGTDAFVEALFRELDRLEAGGAPFDPNAPIPQTKPQPPPVRNAPSAPTGSQQEFRRNFRGPPQHMKNNNMPKMPTLTMPDGTPMPFPFPLPPFPVQQQHKPPKKYSHISSIQNEMSIANKRIVVEKVPLEHLNEEAIRSFFGKFGEIVAVRLDVPQGLAEIEFTSHGDAQKAHDSPEPIFDNRFIKVYWRKHTPGQEPEPLDLESVQRAQAIKQQRFEEKEAKRRELHAKMQEVVSQRTSLLKEQADMLASSGGQPNPALTEKQAKTEALKQTLDDLRAEANRLGLGIGGNTQFGGRGGYRGGYRGRGGSGPYGRGGGPYRGGYRGGRGAFGAKPLGLAGASLDRRPKAVLLKGLPIEKDELFRSHLVSANPTNVERQGPGSILVDFPDRRSAENFYFSVPEMTDLGPLEREWVRIDPAEDGLKMVEN